MTQIKIIGQWKVFEPRNIDTIFSQKKQQIAELKDTNDLLIRQMGLESTLFIDQGNGISGDTYQKHRINLKENTFQLEYSLETYGFIKEVRLDPFEDHWGTVKLDRVELLTLENQNVLYDLTNVRSNGRVLSSGEIRFETIDPMIYLPIDGSFKRIIFSGTKELLPYSEIENEVTEYRELLDGGDFTAVLFLENEHFNCYTKRVVYLDKEKFKIQFKFEHVQYIKSLKIEVSKRKIKKIRLRKIVYSSDFKKNRVFNLNLVQIDALKNGSGEILLKEDGSFVLFPGIGKVSSIEIVGYISKK